MCDSAAARKVIKAFFLISFLILSFHSFSEAAKPKQDLFFKNHSDLVFQAEELNVGVKTPCVLTVHYVGKDPVQALVKVYLDGTNITSFPVEFKKSGTQTGNFSFRTERQGKHHLEFVIMTAGEVQEKEFDNNRISVAFMVPGAVRNYVEPDPKPEPIAALPVEQPKTEEELKITSEPAKEIPKKRKNREVKIERVPKKEQIKKQEEAPPVIQKEDPDLQRMREREEEILRGGESWPEQDLNYTGDPATYLDQEDPYAADRVVPKEYETTAFSKGKPIIDVYFPDDNAFKVNKPKVKDRLTLSWELLIKSSGEGEGEIQVVVADGNKKIITQHAWLRAGETMHLPMKATFDRSGPHRLTAMINTQNNFVDRNMENNIVEQTIQIQ